MPDDLRNDKNRFVNSHIYQNNDLYKNVQTYSFWDSM